MRAVVLRNGRLEVRQTSDPVPGDGELLVRTVSTAICASDIHHMDHPGGDNSLFVWDANRDVVMGHEFVGEVVAYGPGCAGTHPIGSRVTAIPALIRNGGIQVIGAHPDATGSFGELFVVSETMARPVPAEADVDSVAVCDAFAVGEGYVALSRIEVGELPLVVGAGAIGLSTVAALAARGIQPILVSDLNSDRLALATKFGPTIGVLASERSPHQVWQETATARQVTAPAVIFECVGAPGLLQRIVDECPPGARILAAGGWYTGDTIDVTGATTKGLSIQFGGAPGPDAWYGTLDAILSGRLDPRPSIGMVVTLEGVPDAIELARKADGPPRIVVHPQE
jgi:threonine dehydrogenase-like Zn-dependent dehydrogenase